MSALSPSRASGCCTSARASIAALIGTHSRPGGIASWASTGTRSSALRPNIYLASAPFLDAHQVRVVVPEHEGATVADLIDRFVADASRERVRAYIGGDLIL